MEGCKWHVGIARWEERFISKRRILSVRGKLRPAARNMSSALSKVATKSLLGRLKALGVKSFKLRNVDSDIFAYMMSLQDVHSEWSNHFNVRYPAIGLYVITSTIFLSHQ
jgi:hypothetical protein